MRVGIITFHFAINCGAVLQSYALQCALQKIGAEPVIINYQPKYHTSRYAAYRNPFLQARQIWTKTTGKPCAYRFYRAVRCFAGTIYDYRKGKERKKLNARFEAFIRKNLLLTELYTSYEALLSANFCYDAYISGSDQLWNPMLTNNRLDPAYFLQFAPANKNKLTYAISVCQLDVNKYIEQLRKYTKDIENISIREEIAKKDLEETLGKAVNVHIDPTLLLSSEDYNRICKQCDKIESDYVAIYALQETKDHEVFQYAMELAKQLGLVLIDISPEYHAGDCFHRNGVDPRGFLSYIQGAAYVITNSFHGTCFSILYHKRFLVIPHRSRGSRTNDLLKILSLNERIIAEETPGESGVELMEHTIDYEAVDKKLMGLRRIAYEYLEKALRKGA